MKLIKEAKLLQQLAGINEINAPYIIVHTVYKTND
jgi:hypothetical protein